MDDLTRYLRPAPRHAVSLLTLSAVAAIAAVWLAVRSHADHEAAGMLRQQEATLRAASRSKPPPTLSKVQTEDLKRWTALKVERDFDWKPVFAAVERAGNPDIELLAFQPDKAGRRIVLRGEGRDTLAVVEFIERVVHQKALRDVHLTKQKVMQRQGLTTMEFEIKAALAY